MYALFRKDSFKLSGR